MLESPCRGYRVQDRKLSSGEQLHPAGYLDQFRILSRYSMRNLCFSKRKAPGGGVEILDDALKAAQACVEEELADGPERRV